jgi:D-proline reductase (dithiol) PrdB
VHAKSDPPLDVCHPFGDFRFRRVCSNLRHEDLVIHQLKYPHDDADLDINVIFPIERLQELASEGVLGGLTTNFFSFIGYNMDPQKFERTVAKDIAESVAVEERADAALLAPAWPICHQSVGLIQREIEARGIATVSVTVARDVTEKIKTPRAIFLPWPMGHHFGVPFHPDLQRRVILEALSLLETVEVSGTIHEVPIRWADVRREAKTLTEQGRKL